MGLDATEATAHTTYTQESTLDDSGACIHFAPDLDGDGVGDTVVGVAAKSDSGDHYSGRVHIMSGPTQGDRTLGRDDHTGRSIDAGGQAGAAWLVTGLSW